MPEAKLTDTYLPYHLYSVVETAIGNFAPSLAAPFVDPDEIEDELELRLVGVPIDACIRNLTFRFEDGPTYWLLIRSLSANAMICKLDGFQCIVIAAGLPMATVKLATSLLGYAAFRQYLLNGVEPPSESGPPIASRTEAIDRALRLPTRWDSRTGKLGSTLNFLTLYLLTSHELGHLALGHLDPQGLQSGAMSEAELSPNDLLRAAESRALEWDADVFAGVSTIWYTGAEQVREDWHEVLADDGAGLRLVVAAAYILFSVMHHASRPVESGRVLTHPPAMVRVSLWAAGALAILANMSARPVEDLHDVSRRTIRAVEIALHEVGGGNMDPDEALELQAAFERMLPEVASHMQSLVQRLPRHRLDGLIWAEALKRPPSD